MATDQCPKCKAELIRKKGKYGDFFGCSTYPDCKFTTKARHDKMPVSTVFRDKAILPGSFESKNKP